MSINGVAQLALLLQSVGGSSVPMAASAPSGYSPYSRALQCGSLVRVSYSVFLTDIGIPMRTRYYDKYERVGWDIFYFFIFSHNMIFSFALCSDQRRSALRSLPTLKLLWWRCYARIFSGYSPRSFCRVCPIGHPSASPCAL